MAQFYRDFSFDPVNQPAEGFVRMPPASGANSNTDAELIVRNNAGALDGRIINLESAQNNRTSFRWTELPPVAEGEIAGRFLRTNTFDSEVLLGAINVNDRLEGIEFYNRSGNWWITRSRASNATVVNKTNLATYSWSIGSAVWIYYRAQLIGGVARLKVWTGAAEDEPAVWTLEAEVDESDGYFEPLKEWVAIGNRRTGRQVFWDFVSFGTDGDPAPLEPIGPPPEPKTPVNLNTTNIQYTSARANWEPAP